MHGSVRLVALGGLGEVGMNCLALEQRGELLIVDCGVTFDRRGLGVDVVHPDFTCLEAFRDRIRGVFLTHGHEDHIGALPYFLKQFDVPVWGPPYALGLVRERLRDHEILAHARLFEAIPRSRYEVGSFTVEPVRVTHSIADATALAISTDAGCVVHTGDFKFDESPVVGEALDVERMSELATEGISLLLSDSTNVDAEGTTGSEHTVAEALEELVVEATGRVVVAMFASNVHRLQALGAIARKTGRRLVLLGRSVGTHSRVARGLGYLDWTDDLVLAAERATELPRASVLAIATGTQAEANAALARLARGEHPLMLESGDTVILSSRAIPGHEPEVYAMMGAFLRRGVFVRSRTTDRRIHVSGHAHRLEQQRMLELLRPRAFVPVHGTLHHLTRHAQLAREVGVCSVCVLENGDVAELSNDELQRVGRWAVGRVHTFGGRAIASSVLRERARLATDGVIVVAVPIDAEGRVNGEVRVTTFGVVDAPSTRLLCREAEREVRVAVDGVRQAETTSEALVVEAARLAARRPFARELGFKPQTVVSVVRAGGSS